MNNFQLEGTIHKFVEDDIAPEHNYQKTVLILKCENGTRTLQYVPIDFPNEKRALLGGYKIGELVNVTCIPKGRMKIKNNRELYYAAYEVVSINRITTE